MHLDRSRLGLNYVQEETIKAIKYFGEEMTYDISCKAPYHNFIANGFVVHNSGKTACALQFGTHAASRGNKVLFFSLEMSAEQLANRELSGYTNIPSMYMRNGRLSKEQINRIIAAADTNSDHPFFIDDTAANRDLFSSGP